jgi:hypothetical protein
MFAIAAGDPFPANEQIQVGISGAQHGDLLTATAAAQRGASEKTGPAS